MIADIKKAAPPRHCGCGKTFSVRMTAKDRALRNGLKRCATYNMMGQCNSFGCRYFARIAVLFFR